MHDSIAPRRFKKILAVVLAIAMLALCACGNAGGRRASVVGIQLDLDGVSDENRAAIISGENSVIADMRSQLVETYGDAVDFDFYYSRPTEDGGKEYVLCDADAAEDNARKQPKDTITVPIDVNGTIDAENRGEVIQKLIEKIVTQLEEWEYQPGTTLAGSVTTTTKPAATTEPPKTTNSTVASTNTTQESTTTPTTTTETSTAKPGAVPKNISLTSAQAKQIQTDMENGDYGARSFDLYGNPFPMLFDFNTDNDSTTSGKMYVTREKFDGNKMVIHIYGNGGGSGNDFQFIQTVQQKVDNPVKNDPHNQLSATVFVIVGGKDKYGWRLVWDFTYIVSENQRFAFGSSHCKPETVSNWLAQPDASIVDLGSYFSK